MTDGVIFDLDGTLWDSTQEILNCYRQYFPQLTLWKLRKLMGKSSAQIAAELGTDAETIQRIQDSEIEWLSEHIVAPYVEVTGLIQYLNTRDIPCYIVSNCQARYIECFLYTSGLTKSFHDWVSHGDNGYDKASNIKLIVDRNHIKNPVFVGDTEGDKEAASYNHMKFIWAAYGFGEAKYYDVMINSPLDLARYI